MPSNQQALRLSLREKRRSIDCEQRKALDQCIAFNLINSRVFTRSQRIGAYLINDGEVDPVFTLSTAWNRGKRCFLPVLSPLKPKHLWFCEYSANEILTSNKFGIPEPIPNANNRIALQHLDLVLLPLVGFDSFGTRIGMGGGYYDRTFAFRKPRKHWRKPLLVGLAYDLQRCSQLQRNKWDIPLDIVVTESGIHTFR